MTEGHAGSPALARTRASVALEHARRALAGATAAWKRIPLREPWRVLLPLLAVHWVALVLFAGSVRNNGWLFYQGGDQIWYWTTGWLLGHGWIGEPLVSHGWSLVLAPFALAAGPAYVVALPGIVLLQVLVLAPIALWCVYDLAGRIGGRLVGYLAAGLWTIGPYLAIPFFADRYHEKYVELFLPHPLGLTAMADYPAVVLLLVAAAFAVRAAQGRDWGAALVAGLAAGFAGGIKPSSFIFAPMPAIALLLWRRWRQLLPYGVGIAPALGALTLWKYQGFGFVPAFSYEQVRLAAGADVLLAPYRKYVHIDWSHLHINLLGLREVFWSMRLLEWAPVAGAIAVTRRSPATALFLSLWFWGFFVVKGSAATSSVDSGSFFRLVLPAVPALVVMVAALPVLLPRVGARLADRHALPAPRAVPRWTVALAVLGLGVTPIAAAAVVRPLEGPERSVQVNEIAVPVDAGLGLEGRVEGAAVRLRWREAPSGTGKVFYKLLRSRGRGDVDCILHPGGADECLATGEVARATRSTAAVDRPGPGTWTYRLGVGANYLNDPAAGDIFLVSAPVTVTVR